MIVDRSALVSLVAADAGFATLFDLLADAPIIKLGAPSLAEDAMVLDGRDARWPQGSSSRLALIIARFETGTVSFEPRHSPVAWAAFLRYGKGRHPAARDFGDCLTYGIARLSGLLLLCVGDDFRQTDLELVQLPA
jgi:ribonuclease VapC